MKPKLFEPNRLLELSVFFIDDLIRNEIKEIGIDVATQHPTSKRLYGWGEIDENTVYDVGLKVNRDDDPERHANIADWPRVRGERKLKQILLASSSRPVRLNPPIEVP